MEIGELLAKSDLDLLQLLAAGEAMKNTRELIRTIHVNPEINSVEKRQLIDQAYDTMIQIARFSLDNYFDKGDD